MNEPVMQLLRHMLIDHALKSHNKKRFMQLTSRRWRQYVVIKDESDSDGE